MGLSFVVGLARGDRSKILRLGSFRLQTGWQLGRIFSIYLHRGGLEWQCSGWMWLFSI